MIFLKYVPIAILAGLTILGLLLGLRALAYEPIWVKAFGVLWILYFVYLVNGVYTKIIKEIKGEDKGKNNNLDQRC